MGQGQWPEVQRRWCPCVHLGPSARALHDLGKLIRKSAPWAVRTDRQNAGHAIGHRCDAESGHKQLPRWCSANVDILAANAQTLAASGRLRDVLNMCSQRHLRYIKYKHASQLGQASHLEILTIQMNHVEYHMAMEWPIDARNRRNVPCACFGHTPKRVARSLRTKKCL